MNERDIDLTTAIFRNTIDPPGQKQKNYKKTLTNWSTGVKTGGSYSILSTRNFPITMDVLTEKVREGTTRYNYVILGGGNDLDMWM